MSRARRVLTSIALAAALAVAAGVPAAGSTSSGLGTPTGFQFVTHEPVEPGVEHYVLRSSEPLQEAHVARISSSLVGRLRVLRSRDLIAGPAPRRETTSSMCLRVRCVVGINGDFSDKATGDLAGVMVAAGELWRTPSFRHGRFSIDAFGVPSIGHDLDWRGRLLAADNQIDLWGVNVNRGTDAVVLYTARYGPSTLTSPEGRELVLEVGAPTPDGTPVRLVRLHAGGDHPIEPGHVVVSGQGAGAAAVESLWRAWRNSDPSALGTLAIDPGGAVEAIGGSPILVRDRQWAFPDNDDSFTRSSNPRTVVGWTAAGDFLFVTVDGRQPEHSTGMSLHSAASLLIELGAVEALNLDGGGSTTFVVKSRVRNRPSDWGNERSVGSALVLLPVPGSVAVADPRGIDQACPGTDVPEDGFLDVLDTNPHEAAVDCVAWWLVARGVTAHDFRPGATVTRAQLASLLANLVEHSGGTLPPGTDTFPDDDGSPHEASIDRMAAAGILAGRGDGTFGPDLHVTRGQLAAALARTLAYRQGAPIDATADYFADDDDSVHEAAIDQVAAAGLVSGASLNIYAPGGSLRRDQLATTLARALDLLVAQGMAHPPVAG